MRGKKKWSQEALEGGNGISIKEIKIEGRSAVSGEISGSSFGSSIGGRSVIQSAGNNK